MLKLTLLVSLSLALAAAAQPAEVSIGDVCSPGSRPLTRLSQVSGLAPRGVPLHGHSLSECQTILQRLQLVLARNQSSSMCDDTAAETMPEVLGILLDSPKAAPKSLTNLVKAFAFELSAKCKLNALKHAPAAHSLLSPQQLAPILRLEQAGAMLIDENIPNTVDVFSLASALRGFLLDEDLKQELDFQLKPAVKDFLTSFRDSCQASYEPLALKLLGTPLALGVTAADYSLQGDLTRHQAAQLSADKDIRRWLNVLLLCDSVQMTDYFWGQQGPQKDSRLPDAPFPSEQPIGDPLLFAEPKTLALLADMSKKQARATAKLRADVYKRLVGRRQPSGEPDSSFWNSYIQKINDKLAA